MPHILGIDTQVHLVLSLFRPFYLPVVGATTRDIILQHVHDIKPETATSDIDDDVELCKASQDYTSYGVYWKVFVQLKKLCPRFFPYRD